MMHALLFMLAIAVQDGFVLRDVRVLADDGEAVVERAQLVVLGDRIAAILGPQDQAPEGLAVIDDLAGCTVIPGLIDAHTHFTGDDVDPVYLAWGVTTVRDLGGPEDVSWQRKRLGATATDRPRLVVVGPIFDGSPPVWPFSVTPADPEEARAEVQRVVAAGADQIKVYSKLQPEVYRAIVAAAHAAGVKAIGHVPLSLDARDAIAAGQDEIEHLDGVVNACGPGTPRDVTDFTQRETRLWLGMDDECLDELAQELADAGMVMCPTLIVLERIARMGQPELEGDENLRHVSAATRAWWDSRSAWTGQNPAGARAYWHAAGQAFERKLDFVRRLHEHGVRIIAGSDTPNPYVIAGPSLHQELALLVRAGLPAATALRAATAEAASAIGLADELGTIATGKLADLVVLRDDPLLDIAATTAIEAVVHRGRLFRRAELDALLAAQAAAMQDAEQPIAEAQDAVDAEVAGRVLHRLTYAATFGGRPSGGEVATIRELDGGDVDIRADVDSRFPAPTNTHYHGVFAADGTLRELTITRTAGGDATLASYRVAADGVEVSITGPDGEVAAAQLAGAAGGVGLTCDSMALAYADALAGEARRPMLSIDSATLQASIVAAQERPHGVAEVRTFKFGEVAGERREAQVDVMGAKVPLLMFIDADGVPLRLELKMPFGAFVLEATDKRSD